MHRCQPLHRLRLSHRPSRVPSEIPGFCQEMADGSCEGCRFCSSLKLFQRRAYPLSQLPRLLVQRLERRERRTCGDCRLLSCRRKPGSEMNGCSCADLSRLPLSPFMSSPHDSTIQWCAFSLYLVLHRPPAGGTEATVPAPQHTRSHNSPCR